MNSHKGKTEQTILIAVHVVVPAGPDRADLVQVSRLLLTRRAGALVAGEQGHLWQINYEARFDRCSQASLTETWLRLTGNWLSNDH